MVLGAGMLAPSTAGAESESPIPEQTFSSCEGVQTPCNFEPEKCPHPKTCPNYSLLFQADQGWEAGADGLIHIDYWVNPEGQTQPLKPTDPWLPADQVVAAVQAAFATWEAWNPRLRFHFAGITDATPNPLVRDGKNVIGFGPLAHFSASAAGFHDGRHIVESDITLNSRTPWIWRPCQQQDDSCTDQTTTYHYFEDELAQAGLGDTVIIQSGAVLDIQAVTTHEVGHLLGLGHAPGLESRFLTMLSASGNESFGDKRHQNTPGLGDVLGLRVLYPFECPAEGEPVPPEYRNVCPTITIYAP